WLRKLGYRRHKIQKGLYVDGHERADVLEYRNDVFLPQMAQFEKFMRTYDGEELIPQEPQLNGQLRIIPLFHDESCIHAWDYKAHVWLPDGKTQVPRKSKGRIVHISDFITPEGVGRLVYRDENGNEHNARTIIYPGTKGDDWWDTKQLIEQLTRTMSIFTAMYPDAQALFICDQSSAHASHGEGALNAYKLNKGDGGKVTPQRDTEFPPETAIPELVGKKQELSFLDAAGVRKAKGLVTILTERGIDPKGKNGKCPKGCADGAIDCCLARMLSLHHDFRTEKPALQKLIEERGHCCIFLPKFHCELNVIEMYWGWVKTRYRQTVKKSWEEAKVAAVNALNACPPDVIRRFCRRAFRYMDAYRKGLSAVQAAFAVRKYSSHRCVPQSVFMSVDALLN
ncbi:hypothetical protein JCM5296_006964, partial [Sporobolomyces johnsonii]